MTATDDVIDIVTGLFARTMQAVKDGGEGPAKVAKQAGKGAELATS